MSTQIVKPAAEIVEAIDRMLPDAVFIQHGITWDEYEEILDAVGEASGLRISYDEGTLQIKTLSQRHEIYARLIERIVSALSRELRIRVLSYGSMTMRTLRSRKGVEPDACFYVQNARLVGTKEEIDFATDPPPDVVVEIDLHHESIPKFPIYAALGVPEFWRYDGANFTIYHLKEGQYGVSESSLAFPVLTSAVLTQFLARSPKEDQYDILIAFEEWLNGQ